MRRVLLPLVATLAGCTVAEPLPVYELPPMSAEEREQDLKHNLRGGHTWDEQDQLMKDVKGAFGQPSDADSLGPKTKAGPR